MTNNQHTTMTNKCQQCDNNMTNKNAQPSQLQEVSDNKVTTKRQLSDNPIKEKEKENNIYSENMANTIKKWYDKYGYSNCLDL